MVKYAPRKVYIRESGGYVELSYTEFCRCRESDQTYMAVSYTHLDVYKRQGNRHLGATAFRLSKTVP